MLAMGGSALGEAVKSSGLLSAIAHGIQDLIVDRGTWAVLAIFCALVLVATTFISHTVGAMVILPIVQAVGADMSVSPQSPGLQGFAGTMAWFGPVPHALSGSANASWASWTQDWGFRCPLRPSALVCILP